MHITMVYHLHKLKSDQCPLAINLGIRNPFKVPKLFRFLNCWLSHNDFTSFGKENWSGDVILDRMILRFIDAVKDWNKKVFCSIQTKKCILIARISGIQKSIEKFRTRNLVKLEKELQTKLERILDSEELIWK